MIIEILAFLLGWYFDDIIDGLKHEDYPDKPGSICGRYPVVYD